MSGQLGAAAPTVSWLVCTHRDDDKLSVALESCLSQTFDDFELLVVVNGGDATRIATRLRMQWSTTPRVRIFETGIRHLNFSLNLGLHHAQGRYVARMDADDIADRDRLRRQVEFLDAHPEVIVLGTAYDLVDETGAALRRVVPPLDDAAIRCSLYRGNPLCHPTVMFRRAYVCGLGGYLGGLHGEDYDLWSRVAADPAARFANLAQAGLGYRATPSGEARRSRHAYANMGAAQFRDFVEGLGTAWLVAATWSWAKSRIRSRRPSKDGEAP